MRTILAYSFNTAAPVSFSRAGKFEAFSDDWMHSASRLEDFELIIVTQNDLYMSYRDVKYTVHPGEYLLLAPLQRDRTKEELGRLRKGFQKSKCSFYWMHFNCQDVAERTSLNVDYINDGRSNLLIPVHGQLAVPERALLMMVQLQDSILSGYDLHYFDLFATLILSEIANQHQLRYRTELQTRLNGSRQLFSDITGYIEHEIGKPLRVSDIAARFGYNEKYLSRLFKRYTGLGLKQYIQKQKIQRADFLLVDSSIPVSEIAASLGFSSYHSFERTYVACRSMTPTVCRQLYARKINNHA